MFRIYCTTLLASLGTLAAQAQAPALPADQARTEATYRLTYQPDSTSPTTRTELLRLQIGSKLSRFVSLNQLFRDSLTRAVTAQAERAHAQGETMPTINFTGLPAGRMSTATSGNIYKMAAAGQVVVFDKVFTTHYSYPEPAGPLAWTITPTTATVAGYACQRATLALGGRTWEAWFTREVPLAEGPYKFYGLPGLIVQISDTRHAYTFELLKLRQLTPPVPIELPAPATSTTREKFRQAQAEFARNGLTMMMGQGNVRLQGATDEADLRRKVQENAKKRNNPLELRYLRLCP